MIMDAKLEQILKRVQACLAKANDEATSPEEAALYREKAEQLMIKYRIDAAAVGTTEAGDPLRPEWSEVDLGYSEEWADYLYSMAMNVARHTGIRIRPAYVSGRGYVATVCGFVHDVAFFELMYTNVMYAFSSRLEPVFNPEESEAANALRLRQGGMERGRIAKIIFADTPATTLNEQKGQNRKVTSMIKKEAERIGDPKAAEEVLGRGFNAKTYRKSYALGFYGELLDRLRLARLQSNDGGMILKSAKERVDEAWYERYPEYRPTPPSEHREWKDPRNDCDKCKASKRGACREHYTPTGSYRAPTYSASAMARGRSAARSVDLGGKGNTRTAKIGS